MRSAPWLERNTGAKAIVINQTAGGGTVAVSSIFNAPPDGSMLLVFHAMLHVSHHTGRLAEGASDLTPLATISRASDVYVTAADAPYSNLREFIDHSARQELLVASQMGGTTQLKATALASAARQHGGQLRPVAIGSMAKRLTALLGGQVDVSIVDLKTARQYLEAGEVKPLAVISSQRDPFEPDWPTALEQGVDIDLAQVGEVYAPPGMSVETRDRLDELLGKALQDPQLARDLARVMQAPEYRGAADTQAFVRAESARVKQLLDTGE